MPQAPTRWLEPKLLVLIAVQVALSTKFAEFFDRRDAQAHLPEPTRPDADHGSNRVPGRLVGGAASAGRWSLTEGARGFDFTGADELWLDYVADSGDGFDATTTIASVVARDVLNLPDPAGGGPTRVPETVHETRAGAVLVLGGDQAYPFATMEEYRNRLVGPFRAVLPWTWRPRWLFAIPGNHDWYDGLAELRQAVLPGPLGRRLAEHADAQLLRPGPAAQLAPVGGGRGAGYRHRHRPARLLRRARPGSAAGGADRAVRGQADVDRPAPRRSRGFRRARVLRAHGDRRSCCAAPDPVRRPAPLRPLHRRRRREQDHRGGRWRVPRAHPSPGHPRPATRPRHAPGRVGRVPQAVRAPPCLPEQG